MQRPNNYENTQASGEFIPIELGGHTAVIKRVEETTSKTGRPMIKVAIDFDTADIQPDYFRKQFDADTRDGKTWPFQAVQYILTEDNDGNCSRSFKTFISCVEKSNNASVEWGDAFERWFKNKKVGVVYGEKEEEYNGEIKTRRRIRYFCQYDKAKDASIPDKQFLREMTSQAAPAPGNDINKWVSVQQGVDDEIPF